MTSCATKVAAAVLAALLSACSTTVPERSTSAPRLDPPASAERHIAEETSGAVATLPDRATLADCIRIALANHASGRVAAADVALAESFVREAQSAYWPRLKLTSRAMRLDEDPMFVFEGQNLDLGRASRSLADAAALAELVNFGLDPNPGDPIFDQAYDLARNKARRALRRSKTPDIEAGLLDRDAWSTTLELAYPLYTGGKITAANARARIGVDVAESRRRATDDEIAFQVTRFYYASVFAGEIVRLGEETLTRFGVTLDLTERVYETGSGTVTKADYLKTKVIYSTIEGQVHVLRQNQGLARTALLNQMGLPPTTPLTLADENLAEVKIVLDEERLVSDAFGSRPDWKQVHLGIRAAEHEVDQEKSARYPLVAAFAQFNHLDNDFDRGLMPFAEDTWTVGVQLELSIFDGFATEARVDRARAGLQRLQHLERLLEEGIRAEVRAELLRAAAARADLDSAKQGIADAEENRKLNLRAYEVEMVETQDVIESQLLEALTKARHFKARHDFDVAAARLRFVTGTMRDGGAQEVGQ